MTNDAFRSMRPCSLDDRRRRLPTTPAVFTILLAYGSERLGARFFCACLMGSDSSGPALARLQEVSHTVINARKNYHAYVAEELASSVKPPDQAAALEKRRAALERKTTQALLHGAARMLTKRQGRSHDDSPHLSTTGGNR